MLTRLRIEVEGEDSAASTEAALTKYEHALQWAEASRYLLRELLHRSTDERLPDWPTEVAERSYFNAELGREVTDEVIEFDPSLPGYRGRRVVRFTRLDTRSMHYREDLVAAGFDGADSDDGSD